MNTNENDNVTLSALIAGYDYEMKIYLQKRSTLIIFVLLGFITGWILVIVGYILFLKRIQAKKKLNKLRKEITDKLNSTSEKITIEEYLELKKRIILAGRNNKA